MVQRLDCECKCHKYVVFFTLTYGNEFLPKLHVLGDCCYDPNINRHAPDRPRISFNLRDCEHTEKDLKYIHKFVDSGIPYLSKYDVQCFMKRLRINTFRLHKKFNINEEKSFLRYYICGEYGPKNYRPHFHGILFFDSEITAKNIESLLYKSWSFGFIDFSFVKNSCNSYVAQYVNCTSNLPAVYRHREIRQFCLYSTCPPIGSNYFNDEKIREIFDNCAPTFLLSDVKRRKVVDVPLWRYYQDRLFPRCPLFNKISHFDRVALYRIASNFPFTSASEFVDWCKESGTKSEQLSTLLDHVSNKFKVESSLYRLYYISQLVITNSLFFDVDVSTYVEHIERYYDNCNMWNLKNQLAYEVEYLDKKSGKLSDLVWIDRVWFNSLLHSDPCPSDDVDDTLRIQLDSFGIDVDRFFSMDLTDRKVYLDSFDLSLTLDYRYHNDNTQKLLNDSTKVKKKNDYLSSDGICLSNLYENL